MVLFCARRGCIACLIVCACQSAMKRQTMASSRFWPSSGVAIVIERFGRPLKQPIFDELAIIGVGLIGSSVARAVRRRKAARRIVLVDRSEETLARADALALGDETTSDAARAVENADCVILCVPVGANEEVAGAIAPALRR